MAIRPELVTKLMTVLQEQKEFIPIAEQEQIIFKLKEDKDAECRKLAANLAILRKLLEEEKSDSNVQETDQKNVELPSEDNIDADMQEFLDGIECANNAATVVSVVVEEPDDVSHPNLDSDEQTKAVPLTEALDEHSEQIDAATYEETLKNVDEQNFSDGSQSPGNMPASVSIVVEEPDEVSRPSLDSELDADKQHFSDGSKSPGNIPTLVSVVVKDTDEFTRECWDSDEEVVGESDEQSLAVDLEEQEGSDTVALEEQEGSDPLALGEQKGSHPVECKTNVKKTIVDIPVESMEDIMDRITMEWNIACKCK